MSYRKFGKNDVRINTLKAHPNCDILIYKSEMYLNNEGRQLGQWQTASADPGNVYMTKTGYVNLYEYNIDRADPRLPDYDWNPLIYPFLSKDSSRISMAITGTYGDDPRFLSEFAYGDTITGSYPLKTSIRREFITGAAAPSYKFCTSSIASEFLKCKAQARSKSKCRNNMTYYSLRTILDLYGALSPHYKPKSRYGNKDKQDLNVIHIPSIFYGEKIKPGTVSLKWYITGSLLAEVRDIRENGELVQVGPTGSLGEISASVQGVVLYNEGFIILTGSRRLGKPGNYPPDIGLDSAGAFQTASWKYWGAGARDGINTSTAAAGFGKASFGLNFKGTTKTEVVTMYAHAHRGKVNYSNNPTFLRFNEPVTYFTSSHVYEENPNRRIKNTRSSSYKEYKDSFKRQVYISKIAVYDDEKNLIGIATLPAPILKEEDQDISFKLKMDI